MKHPSRAILKAIERNFHEVIRGRVALLHEPPANLKLPRLDETTPTTEDERAWFPVPGMCGGFAYWLDLTSEPPKLISESWCRVCEGSGERHEIDTAGSKLVAEGFV
ncbi:MAG: hypothetical protein FJ398_11115 [Verrucomicrobia bacterium]|nr:hypothetical protein [Verrucomicrobiota bacterium]